MTIAFPRVCFGQWLCPSLLLWGMWTWRQGCVLHTLSFWVSTNRGTFGPYCQNSSFLTTNLWLLFPGGWETLWLPEPKAWTVCSSLPAALFSGSSSRMEKSPCWRQMPSPVCSLPSGSVHPGREWSTHMSKELYFAKNDVSFGRRHSREWFHTELQRS